MISSGQFREAAIEMLARSNPRYHLTVDFPRNTYPVVTQDTLNDFFSLINRDIYKGRYKSGSSHLNGFCVREPTTSMNTVHYHILITDCEYLPDKVRFEKIISNKVKLLKFKRGKNRITKFELQSYYNEEDKKELEKYLTKQFESIRDGETAMNNIGVICWSGVNFDLYDQYR